MTKELREEIEVLWAAAKLNAEARPIPRATRTYGTTFDPGTDEPDSVPIVEWLTKRAQEVRELKNELTLTTAQRDAAQSMFGELRESIAQHQRDNAELRVRLGQFERREELVQQLVRLAGEDNHYFEADCDGCLELARAVSAVATFSLKPGGNGP